jgi:hypothetical protein
VIIVVLKKLTKKETKSVLEGKTLEELRQEDKKDWSREDLIKYAEMLQE